MLLRLAIYCSLLLPHNEAAYCLCHPKLSFANWSRNTILCKNLGYVTAEDNISDACDFYSTGALKEMHAVDASCNFDYPVRSNLILGIQCVFAQHMTPDMIPQFCFVKQCDVQYEPSTPYENALKSHYAKEKKMANSRVDTAVGIAAAVSSGFALQLTLRHLQKRRYAVNDNNLQTPLLATHPDQIVFVQSPDELEDTHGDNQAHGAPPAERIAAEEERHDPESNSHANPSTQDSIQDDKLEDAHGDNQAHRAPPVERIAAEEERHDLESNSRSNPSTQDSIQEDHLLRAMQEYETFSRQETPAQ